MTDTEDTEDATVDETIIMWRDRGVNPGGIANVLKALGHGQWTAKAVREALDRLDEKAGVVREAEAIFTTPGDDYEDGADGWEGHGGDKFVGPLLDSTGRDVRDNGAPGEQGGPQGDWDVVDTSFADKAAAHSERCEEAEKDKPFGTTG